MNDKELLEEIEKYFVNKAKEDRNLNNLNRISEYLDEYFNLYPDVLESYKYEEGKLTTEQLLLIFLWDKLEYTSVYKGERCALKYKTTASFYQRMVKKFPKWEDELGTTFMCKSCGQKHHYKDIHKIGC